MPDGLASVAPCALCCGSATGVLCPGCRADLPWLDNACPGCGAALHGTQCAACRVKPPPWDRVVAPFWYSYPLDRLVHGFKYQRRLFWGRFLAREMARRITLGGGRLPECLIPVPIHRGRLSVRGFNQSLELGRAVGAELGIRVLAYAVERVDVRPSLVGMNALQRQRLVRGAFRLSRRNLQAPTVAIVDDILTTGATAGELAGLLVSAGVQRVEVWVAARTP